MRVQLGSRTAHLVLLSLAAMEFVGVASLAAMDSPKVAPKIVPKIASKIVPVPTVVSAELSTPSAASPEGLVASRPVESRPGVAFVKLMLAFEPAIEAQSVSLETCAGEFRDGIEFFAHPGTRRVYVEGGTKVATADFGARLPEIATLAINFRHNSSLCLKSLQFKNASGVIVAVHVPETAADGANLANLANVGATKVKEFEKRRQQFASADLDAVIDQELTPGSADDEKWIFRFRGDGTFFIFGRSDELQTNGRFSAVGDYEIKTVEKNHIRLLLSGSRFASAEPWDGWHCSHPCPTGRELAMAKAFGGPIRETIEIEKLRTGGYMVRNRVKARSRTLFFSDIQVRTSVP